MPRSGPLPLSLEQQQIWLAARTLPEAPVYNECFTVYLPDSLDRDAFERAFNEFVRRHEAWRTTFEFVDGQPVQVVHPAQILRLPYLDLRHLPREVRWTEAKRLALEQAVRPFDLVCLPLVRPLLVRVDDENHALFLCAHHIIVDSLAMQDVFLAEVAAVYDAFMRGEPSPLSALNLQPADYACWQRQCLNEARLAEGLAYWLRQLNGSPDALDLPSDRPRPSVQTFRGAVHSFEIIGDLRASLKRLAQEESVTLDIVILSAFFALMHRYTGQDDLMIGTVAAGRARPETAKMMGYFLNPLVLRANLSGDPMFRQLLGRVRDVLCGALAHQDLPFEYLVKALQVKKDPSCNPIFQVLVTFEPPELEVPLGWTLTAMDVHPATSKFDLTLELHGGAERFILRFEYATDQFDAASISGMVDHLTTMLQAVAIDADQRLSQLPLLAAAERNQLLVEWNDNAAQFPGSFCVHELFEAQAARTPEAIAAVFESQQLTYCELDRRSNQLARFLAQMKVGPGTLVGIGVERSLEMLVGVLGILKAGSAYLPFDPGYPQERLRCMVEDAGLGIVLTQTSFASRFPSQVQTLCLDTEWPAITPFPASSLSAEVSPEHPAYVIYTSGSTGCPKGTEIPHSALANLLQSMVQEPGITAEDRLLAITTLGFDIAALELLGPLLVGGCVVIASRERAADGLALGKLLQESSATIMQATPSTWRMLVESGWMGDKRLKLLSGGEALLPDLAQALCERAGAVWNMYGPTETTIWSALCRVQHVDGRPIPLGRGIANTSLYVLDSQRQLVPPGVPGELYIGGAGLATGYIGHPELTGERFILAPSVSTCRLYRTGDQVCWRRNGQLYFLRRMDNQVKLRGYRVELGEIEAVLRRHELVRDAVVVIRGTTPSEEALAAYVVPAGHPGPESSMLRNYLKDKVPDYMVPSAFILLDAIPLTPNGKLDRRALSVGVGGVNRPNVSQVLPNRTLDHQLVAIWEDLLDVRPIGITDDFFELGGHSLLAAQLMARIEDITGRRLPLAALFGGATIKHLVDILLQPNEGEVRSPLVCVQAGGSRTPFFFLHGDPDGGGFYCRNLAKLLGRDRPFYALQPHGLWGDEIPDSVTTMAASFVEPIREIQPAGPYLLGGFCSAGVVALELARHLNALGDQVALVVMIDSLRPPPPLVVARRVLEMVGPPIGLDSGRQVKAYLRVREIASWLKEQRKWFGELRRPIDERPRRRWPSHLQQTGNGAPALAAVAENGMGAERQHRYDWAETGYSRTPYWGTVVQLWAREDLGHNRKAPSSDWRRELRTIDTRSVSGTHLTCLTRHVAEVAEQLRSCIDRYGCEELN